MYLPIDYNCFDNQHFHKTKIICKKRVTCKKKLGLVNEYTNIPNTANNDIVHSDNHDNSDQTLVKSIVDSVQSDGPDLTQSDISDEILIKCLDDDHEFDPETSDQTDSVKTNTHKPVEFIITKFVMTFTLNQYLPCSMIQNDFI
jgi:hypothetical protein